METLLTLEDQRMRQHTRWNGDPTLACLQESAERHGACPEGLAAATNENKEQIGHNCRGGHRARALPAALSLPLRRLAATFWTICRALSEIFEHTSAWLHARWEHLLTIDRHGRHILSTLAHVVSV